MIEISTASAPTEEGGESPYAVVARWDDGGVNTVGHDAVVALNQALDQAEEASLPLVIIGRDGVLSAGFDLSVFAEGPEAMFGLTLSGANVLQRMVDSPVPVIVGSPGHAVAMGAMMLLAADVRVGVDTIAGKPDKKIKIGLNEVAIGMTLPHFAMTVAADRISKRHFTRATAFAQLYTSSEALDAGFLDEVVAPGDLDATVLGMAQMAAGLPMANFSGTKRRLRADVSTALAQAMIDDKAAFDRSLA